MFARNQLHRDLVPCADKVVNGTGAPLFAPQTVKLRPSISPVQAFRRRICAKKLDRVVPYRDRGEKDRRCPTLLIITLRQISLDPSSVRQIAACTSPCEDRTSVTGGQLSKLSPKTATGSDRILHCRVDSGCPNLSMVGLAG